MNAKPYDQIPNYSFWDWSKKVGEGRKAKDLRIQDILQDAFDKTNSEIIKVGELFFFALLRIRKFI